MNDCPGCGSSIAERDLFCGWCRRELASPELDGLPSGNETLVYVDAAGNAPIQVRGCGVNALRIESARVHLAERSRPIPVSMKPVKIAPRATYPLQAPVGKLEDDIPGEVVLVTAAGHEWRRPARFSPIPKLTFGACCGGAAGEVVAPSGTVRLRDEAESVTVRIVVAAASARAVVRRCVLAQDGAERFAWTRGTAPPTVPGLTFRVPPEGAIDDDARMEIDLAFDTTKWADGKKAVLRLAVGLESVAGESVASFDLVYERPARVDFEGRNASLRFPEIIRGTGRWGESVVLENRGVRPARITSIEAAPDPGRLGATKLPAWISFQRSDEPIEPLRPGEPDEKKRQRAVRIDIDSSHTDFPAGDAQGRKWWNGDYVLRFDSGAPVTGHISIQKILDPPPFDEEVTIDFGTSSICVAVADPSAGRHGARLLVFDKSPTERSARIPTLIFFRGIPEASKPDYIVGFEAEIPASGAVEHPYCYVRSVKRMLRDEFVRVSGLDAPDRYVEYRPSAIVAMIMRRVFEMIVRTARRRVDRCSVTFPVVFGPSELAALREGFRDAGIPVHRVRLRVDEPTAASIAYLRGRARDLLASGSAAEPVPIRLATLDVGAGTTDVTFFGVSIGVRDTPKGQRAEIDVQPSAATGRRDYGGDEMTETLMHVVLGKIREAIVAEEAKPRPKGAPPEANPAPALARMHRRIAEDFRLLIRTPRDETNFKLADTAAMNFKRLWYPCDRLKLLLCGVGGGASADVHRLTVRDIEVLLSDGSVQKLPSIPVEVRWKDVGPAWEKEAERLVRLLIDESRRVFRALPDVVLVSGLAAMNPAVTSVVKRDLKGPDIVWSWEARSGVADVEAPAKTIVALGASDFVPMTRDNGGPGIWLVNRDPDGVKGSLRRLVVPLGYLGAIVADGRAFECAFGSGADVPSVSGNAHRIYVPDCTTEEDVAAGRERVGRLVLTIVQRLGSLAGQEYEGVGTLEIALPGRVGAVPFLFELAEDCGIRAYPFAPGALKLDDGDRVLGDDGKPSAPVFGTVKDLPGCLGCFEMKVNRGRPA